ncbi:M81 family metallopeptidase [Paraburkholderia oxyphila]|uniref:M81 family metallopeptidase n=1 Tax=Paraburkholderia oxyphila TaxID=614212 RepID=UPI00047FB413|nr:M81 family metallopeptidase [Paraburkholderia oxyphila]
MHILIAGFQHETNTFAPTKATLQSFVQGEGFPPLARGEDVLALRDVNVPAGGFIAAAQAEGHTLVPVIWAGASASAHVTEQAYERIAGEIVEAVRRGGFDAIYLDLHGAMVAEHLDDGEGELLARVRAIVGPQVPLVVSLDLHANVTGQMFRHADAMVAYRTYPHVDMAETGVRAARILMRMMAARERGLKRAVRRIPFLIPVNGMCTLADPARDLYERLEALERDEVVSLSFTPGFPASDFPECGAAVWGYGFDEAAVTDAVDTLAATIVSQESEWDVRFLDPDEAVREAMRLAEHATRPIVIADTQDNPGVGGDSNTMGLVRALLRHGAKDAAAGLVWDPHAAAKAHEAGVGATVDLALAGGSGIPDDEPLSGAFVVEHLSDGRVRFDGPMMNGMWTDIGPVACLRIGGVKIAVCSVKMQIFDRNLYRVAGIEPERMKILVNKSSVHYRADFDSIAEAHLVAKSPGPMAADPSDLPWTRIDPELRLRPNGASLGELRGSASREHRQAGRRD